MGQKVQDLVVSVHSIQDIGRVKGQPGHPQSVVGAVFVIKKEAKIILIFNANFGSQLLSFFLSFFSLSKIAPKSAYGRPIAMDTELDNWSIPESSKKIKVPE